MVDRVMFEKFVAEEKARMIRQQLLDGNLPRRSSALLDVHRPLPTILAGVGYIQGRNFVHRDIKPGNVLCALSQWPYDFIVTRVRTLVCPTLLTMLKQNTPRRF